MNRLFPILAALTTTFVAGCANLSSIYRTDALPADRPHLVAVDAKQRVVLTNPRDSSATASTLVRFCAEPPPDVFTALAASLGAEASVIQSATPEVTAKLAATLSENAATIERTQTVNILREAMYRNCERYLSGAITEEEFIVQAARDQQLIVQVLAVEQITGVARAQSTALTTVANAAAGGVSDASLAALSEAKQDVDAKRAAKDETASAAAALAPAGACGDSPIDADAPPAGVTAEQAQAKNAKCAAAATAAKLAKEAEEYFALVKQTVAEQGSVSSEARGQLASAALTASAASADIAEKVVEIVRQYQAFDEIGMTCVVKLRTEQDQSKLEFCKELLKQMVNTRTAQLRVEEERLNAERIEAFRTAMEAASQSMAETVWTRLGKGFTPAQLERLAQSAGVDLAQAHKRRLEAAKADFPAFLKAFKRLPPDQQEKLGEAAARP